VRWKIKLIELDIFNITQRYRPPRPVTTIASLVIALGRRRYLNTETTIAGRIVRILFTASLSAQVKFLLPPDAAHVCLNPVTHEECNKESEFRNHLEAGASPTGWGPRRDPKRDANPKAKNKTIMHRSGHYTVTAGSQRLAFVFRCRLSELLDAFLGSPQCFQSNTERAP
jgi:hypothetical protein